MKQLTIFSVIILLFLITGCSKKPINKIGWQPQKLTAGEFSNNWHTDMQYNSKAHILYGISNDTQNLYLSLEVSDPTVKRKIMFTGLTFWINILGKSDEQMELDFPIKQSQQINRNKMLGLSEKTSDIKKSEITKFNKKYINGLSEISIRGFDGETDERLLGNKSKNGINAILISDSLHTLYYEVQIPLDMIFENPTEFLTDSTKTFSYGFETGYITRKPPSHSGKGSGKGGGKGGGKRGGGQGQSRPDSQMMSTMNELSQPSKFTIKTAALSNK